MTIKKSFSWSDRKFALAGALLYAVIVSVLSCFHEVWRDEVIPISIAADAASPADLFVRIINYGHSGLWYYILYAGYALCRQFVILKILNILICVAAIYVFLLKSPFSRLHKGLFMFGVLPLYVYPVVNRDYGLSMLLIFLFCIFYQKRFIHFVSLGVILFLMANVVAYSAVITLAVLGALMLEWACSADSRRQWLQKPWDTLIGFGLIILGIIVSVITLTPDYTMSIVRPPVTAATAAISVVKAVMMPERAYPTIFGFDSGVFLKLMTWAYLVYLWRRNINVFLVVAGSLLGLTMLFHLVWPTTALRHQGAFVLLFIAAMWLDYARPAQEGRPLTFKPLEVVRQLVGRHKHSAFTLILFLQVCSAYPEIKKDIVGDFSASRHLGALIKGDASLKEAIVLPEPDTMGEALAYYADNPVFFPREDQYRKYARFTIESRTWYSLDELLASARKIKGETGKPVLLVFGHKISAQGPFLIQFSGMTRKVFTYTPEAFRDFEASTRKLASFRPSITDEEYEVYLLK